ncbi:hypothetical protein R3P38DRAFT_3225596 [Favolaschia claudopus]|uniref:Uncharacterized protein n=1 Tax=Favolaschia claudopus TaxID=2862362 RepID=A0AAV9ZUR3_9AGAR
MELDRQAVNDILSYRPSNPRQVGGRCRPYFYPEKGHENTNDVDHDPNVRYYVVGLAHCGGGVFTCPVRANREVHNYAGHVKKAVNTWREVESAWGEMHDTHHAGGCPEFTLPPDISAPTPVYFNNSIRTAAASYLPLVSPTVCSPPPCPSTFTPWPSDDAPPPQSAPRDGFGGLIPGAARAPPSPSMPRARPPVTPQPGTQVALGSPFSPCVPSSVSPSPLRPPRAPASFPILSPLAPQAPTPPPPTALYSSPRTSSPLSRVSDVLTASPTSSPRTLSAIDLDEDDEYAAEFAVDDGAYAPRVMWAVKGIRHSSWDDPRNAIAAAQANGMGQMFTLMSSMDELELENMHSWGAVARRALGSR